MASGIGALAQGVGLAVKGLGLLAKSNIVAAASARVLGMSIRGALIASGIGLLIVAVGLLAAAWAGNWGGIREKTAAAVDFLRGLFVRLRGFFGQAVDFIKAHADKLLLLLGPAGAVILGLKHLAGVWSELWGKIRDATADAINPITGSINGLIDALNRIPGVNLGRLGKIGGRGAAATVQVPALHQGGIVRRPTLALLGEKGPEVVVPLGTGMMSGGMNRPNMHRGEPLPRPDRPGRVRHRGHSRLDAQLPGGDPLMALWTQVRGHDGTRWQIIANAGDIRLRRRAGAGEAGFQVNNATVTSATCCAPDGSAKSPSAWTATIRSSAATSTGPASGSAPPAISASNPAWWT